MSRDRVGLLVRERLLDTHHLLEKPAVHPVGWQQRQDAIPVQQVVIQPAAYQPQHVQKRVVVPGNHAPRHAHHPAELAIDRRIDLTRKRKRERRGDTAVTFDDVAVVPNDGRRVLVLVRAQRGNRPRLKEHEPVADRPLDVLRTAEQSFRGGRQRRHLLNLLVGEHRAVDLSGSI